MSKKASKKSSMFTYTPKIELPPLSKIETEWNFKDHYYISDTDPRIEKDAKKYERTARSFIKRFKDTDFTSTPDTLLEALEADEQMEEMSEASRVMRYFSFRTVLNVNDTAAQRKLTQYAERFRKLSNELLFFPLTIGRIEKSMQRAYLKDEKLKKYHYYLKQSFEQAKHYLSEAEERILKLCGPTSSGMWEDATEKIVSNHKVIFKKKEYKLPEALEVLDTLSWTDKGKMWSLLLKEMKDISEIAEHELTAIVTHHKVQDELRGYKKPYSSTVQSYENNEQAVEALVNAISDKGFALSRKFYKLKAKIHNRETIPYENKYDSIGELPRPDYDTSVTICRDAFYAMDTSFGSIFDRMLENGHLDVYPKSGKRGGAFMAATTGLPTYVMLNNQNNFKSLETLAHEMGHAIHAELSKVQPAIYEDFSTTTAETASTFFEQRVMDVVYDTLSEDEKVVFLHDKITRNIATVQRQTAFFNFELEMHQHIRDHGMATKEELAQLMQAHLRDYLGQAVSVTDDDGYSYVYVPHIRYGFYVYTYAYGHLVSNLMLQKYQADPGYLTQINQFLHAGGSDTVENIFKNIGINTRQVGTFLDSLKSQEKEIKELERLTKK
jgi:oligoendopeptidase F